jgi:hypothetical protein
MVHGVLLIYIVWVTTLMMASLLVLLGLVIRNESKSCEQ